MAHFRKLRAMRIGLALPHYDTSLRGEKASWEGVASVARLAEDSGFDSVWVSDHLFLDWGKYGGPPTPQGALECWSTLSGLAAVTERVRLGSLALCNDLRNPGLVAKMAATLDLLSGGRVEIGMGAGWYEPEYAAAGITFDRPSVRIARLEESAEVVARLLEGEVLDFSGRHYEMKGAVCRPGPIQSPRPPIWVCGKGDRLLACAARRADGWNFSWLGSIATYKERAGAADRACEKEGRDPSSLRRSVGAYMLVGEDEGDCRRRFERLASRTPAGVMQSLCGEAGVSWETFRRDRLAGTPDEVRSQIDELADLGVEEVIAGLGALPFQVGDEDDVELVGAALGSR